MVKLSDVLGNESMGAGKGLSGDGNWFVDGGSLVEGGAHKGSRELGGTAEWWGSSGLGSCSVLGSHGWGRSCELVGSGPFVGTRALVDR